MNNLSCKHAEDTNLIIFVSSTERFLVNESEAVHAVRKPKFEIASHPTFANLFLAFKIVIELHCLVVCLKKHFKWENLPTPYVDNNKAISAAGRRWKWQLWAATAMTVRIHCNHWSESTHATQLHIVSVLDSFKRRRRQVLHKLLLIDYKLYILHNV